MTRHSCCAGNVLLASCDSVPHGFRAKISDFGLARNLSIQSKIETRTYGTITHMPLELLCDGIMSKVWQLPHERHLWQPGVVHGVTCTNALTFHIDAYSSHQE